MAKKYSHQKEPEHGKLFPLCLFATNRPANKPGLFSLFMWEEYVGSFFSQNMIETLFDVHRGAKMAHGVIKRELEKEGAKPEMWYEPSFGQVTVTGVGDKIVFRVNLNFKMDPEAGEIFEKVVEEVLHEAHFDRK